MKAAYGIIVTLLLALLMLGCTTPQTPAPSVQPASGPLIFETDDENAKPQTMSDEVTIQIRDKAVIPETVTIEKGTLVRWINLDSNREEEEEERKEKERAEELGADKNATEEHSDSINEGWHRIVGRNFEMYSDKLNKEESFTYVFNTEGRFEYFDENDGAQGLIIVS